MVELHQETEPHESGMLDVGDGHSVYWEVRGKPDGKPAVIVHGGPGSGMNPQGAGLFDPSRYRIVLLDQRGSGRSTPHAADVSSSLEHNTTWHLVDDMELLREHLDVDTWLLYGGSWGSTLALAYAERHPKRVSEIVLAAVTTTRRSEIDWLYRGVGRFFPEQWARFRDSAGSDDVVAAYAGLVNDPDPAVRAKATTDWCKWEDTVLSGETHSEERPYQGRPDAARTALVRICAHYFAHGAWLAEGALIRDAGRLTGIPGVLVHGRFDLGGPLITAWELAQRWPDAELTVVNEAGHLGNDTTRCHILDALTRFADR